MENTNMEKSRLMKAGFILMSILIAFVAIKIVSEIKKDSMLGESATPATVTFSGHGEVQATPDIATIYFSISKDAKTTQAAQDAVALVEKKALDFLGTSNIDSKDIQTSNASVNPKYEYQNTACPQASGEISYCPPGKSVLDGYTASESITVKVRNIDDAGSVMQGLGTLGVTDLSGPNFAVDKADDLKAQARKLAIDDAQAKAKVLAKDLGVSLGKISSFNESGTAYPMMYADKAMASGVAPSAAPATLPQGQNTISSDVSITYEIR